MSFVTSPFKDFGPIPVHFHPSIAEPLQNDAETAPSPTNDEPAQTDTTFFNSDDEMVEQASRSPLTWEDTEFFNFNDDEIVEPASSSSLS